MTEDRPREEQHPAVLWGDMLMGQTVFDRSGRNLGIVEAVATSPSGRLRRIGVRADRSDHRIQFLGVEGAELHLEHIVLPIDVRRAAEIDARVGARGHGRLWLFLDRRRRAVL